MAGKRFFTQFAASLGSSSAAVPSVPDRIFVRWSHVVPLDAQSHHVACLRLLSMLSLRTAFQSRLARAERLSVYRRRIGTRHVRKNSSHELVRLWPGSSFFPGRSPNYLKRKTARAAASLIQTAKEIA
jgi:hypothetical protein